MRASSEQQYTQDQSRIQTLEKELAQQQEDHVNHVQQTEAVHFQTIQEQKANHVKSIQETKEAHAKMVQEQEAFHANAIQENENTHLNTVHEHTIAMHAQLERGKKRNAASRIQTYVRQKRSKHVVKGIVASMYQIKVLRDLRVREEQLHAYSLHQNEVKKVTQEKKVAVNGMQEHHDSTVARHEEYVKDMALQHEQQVEQLQVEREATRNATEKEQAKVAALHHEHIHQLEGQHKAELDEMAQQLMEQQEQAKQTLNVHIAAHQQQLGSYEQNRLKQVKSQELQIVQLKCRHTEHLFTNKFLDQKERVNEVKMAIDETTKALNEQHAANVAMVKKELRLEQEQTLVQIKQDLQSEQQQWLEKEQVSMKETIAASIAQVTHLHNIEMSTALDESVQLVKLRQRHQEELNRIVEERDGQLKHMEEIFNDIEKEHCMELTNVQNSMAVQMERMEGMLNDVEEEYAEQNNAREVFVKEQLVLVLQQVEKEHVVHVETLIEKHERVVVRLREEHSAALLEIDKAMEEAMEEMEETAMERERALEEVVVCRNRMVLLREEHRVRLMTVKNECRVKMEEEGDERPLALALMLLPQDMVPDDVLGDGEGEGTEGEWRDVQDYK